MENDRVATLTKASVEELESLIKDAHAALIQKKTLDKKAAIAYIQNKFLNQVSSKVREEVSAFLASPDLEPHFAATRGEHIDVTIALPTYGDLELKLDVSNRVVYKDEIKNDYGYCEYCDDMYDPLADAYD